jgi:hypothetical protein
MKIIFVALALVFMAQTRAEAGVLIEPYIGYQATLTDIKFGAGAGALDGQSLKVDGAGVGFGLRAGFALPLVFVALDYSMVTLKPTIKEKPAAWTTPLGDQSRTSLGVTAGLDFPIVRPYVGFIFDDQAKDDTSTNMGSGFKIGIGFSLVPKLKLNAEYQSVTYTKAKSTSGTETTFNATQSISSITASGFFINLSIPLEI